MLELQSIFYARFHPERGPSVIVQVPENSPVVSRPSKSRTQDASETNQQDGDSASTINFSDISSYIIPPYDLCGKSLRVDVGKFAVLGWPVSLESETYARNRFTFDVCFVLREQQARELTGEESRSGNTKAHGVREWEQVVRKTALFFQSLELDDAILAAEEARMEDGGPGVVIEKVLENVFQQLRLYNEACYRVNKSHTLNLRLAQPRSLATALEPPKTKANAWDVPLLTRSLPAASSWTHDLVLARVQPHLNGVNHIARVAEVAEVDIKLVKRAVKGLMAEGRVTVIDRFHFQAVYTLTKDFEWFVNDEAMRQECWDYVTSKPSSASNGNGARPKATSLLALYTALAASPSVHDFVIAHRSSLHGIDVRRFVTFGVLKGFLRRKHKFILAVAAASSTPGQGKVSGTSRSGEDAAKEFDRAWRKAALSSGWATPPFSAPEDRSLTGSEQASPEKPEADVAGGISPEDEKLKGFLDGTHCLDEICVEMRMSERKVLERVRSADGRKVFGESVVICK